MEISERQLRSMVADVDDMHHEGMKTFDEDNGELIFGSTTRSARRKFLTGVGAAGAGGALLTIGNAVSPVGSLLSPAGAQALTDTDIAVFAASVEYAAVAAYGAAADSGKVTTPAVGEAAALFADHHQQHGDAFAAFAGTTPDANPGLLEMVGGQIGDAADENAIVEIAFGVENAAAATYLFALGVLEDQAAIDATASILPVEAQHAVALGFVLGKALDDPDLMPSFETSDNALDPAALPVDG